MRSSFRICPDIELCVRGDIAGVGRATHDHESWYPASPRRVLLDSQRYVRQRPDGYNGDVTSSGLIKQSGDRVVASSGTREGRQLDAAQPTLSMNMASINSIRPIQRPTRAPMHGHRCLGERKDS